MKRIKIMQDEEEKIQTTLKYLIAFLGVVVFFILLFMVISRRPTTSFITFFSVAGACLISGAVLGFLFAIPRSGTAKPQQGDVAATGSGALYNDNTNLEEVSDWLTKIIVGLTLVQFNTVLKYLHQSALSISRSFSSDHNIDRHLYSPSYGLIIFFIGCGFALGYLWTRVNFVLILTVSRKRLNSIASLEAAKDRLKLEVAETQQEVDSQKQVLQDVKKEVTAKGSTVTRDFQPKGREADTEALHQFALGESAKRPVVVELDLQKRRWGGKTENKGKKIGARVSENKLSKGYFDIEIEIKSADNKPLAEPVAIFVHDTFKYPDNMAILWPNPLTGTVEHTMLGYEAFTLGALFIDGTDLELDLNQQDGYPRNFYWGK